jgi:hypothetical protein
LNKRIIILYQQWLVILFKVDIPCAPDEIIPGLPLCAPDETSWIAFMCARWNNSWIAGLSTKKWCYSYWRFIYLSFKFKFKFMWCGVVWCVEMLRIVLQILCVCYKKKIRLKVLVAKIWGGSEKMKKKSFWFFIMQFF